jgi:GxxExxY protein
MTTIDDQMSYAVIGCAMAAHRELGPGLDERFYHELMARQLAAAGIDREMKPRAQLVHRGLVADEFEADLIVGKRLVTELKVLRGNFAPEHLLQIICYLKFWNLEAGLLFDFGKGSLKQKRVPRLDHRSSFDVTALRRGLVSMGLKREIRNEIGAAIDLVQADYGLGYRDTTYRGLLFAELKHRGIACIKEPVATIRSGGITLGEARLPCLLVPAQGAILVTALHEAHQHSHRIVLQTYLRHVNLPWGLHVDFGKTRIECQCIRNQNSPGE